MVTFKQAQEANAKIKKGAKSEIVVFWKWIETENKDTGKEEKVPLLRYYRNDKSLRLVIYSLFFRYILWKMVDETTHRY